MSGCGGCGPEGCNGPCSTKKEEGPREPTRLADAIARIVIDNRIIARTVELYELGVVRVEDITAQITYEKGEGRFNGT